MASSVPNGGKRDEKGRNIQVVVRCRPFNTVERKSSYNIIDCDPSRKEVLVKTGGVVDKSSKKTYTFDMVFGPAAKQIDVYRSVVCPILDEVITGYNCTVFAYGQTGTGKTFTMEGERSLEEEFTWEEDPLAGIIPRTLHQIFAKLSENGTEFSVKVSLLEIYNEELFDLLSPSEDMNERLQLFDDPRNKRGVVVKGLEEVTVHNKDEVYQILERGSAKRRTASTLMNAYSSRSHSVFSVTIHMKELTLEGEELVKIGKLNLVDLAGSENIGRSGAVDKRAREAGNINQSLLTLGRVITALVEKRPHVPYRESKLTRILQDSLGGRTKTSIIATVSPSSSNLEETLSTLEYANRAKNIMNKPEVNQKLTKRTLIKEYTEEIERLKRDLAAARDKHGIYLSAENYTSMMEQITASNEHIAEYTERIAALEDELKKVRELFADNKSQLDDKQQRLDETSRDLVATKERLVEEEFISRELHSAQEDLYSTAAQLLTTADASTSDVSGLHAKLDRKKLVEQHNETAQQSFNERMSAAFGDLRHVVRQQGDKHQHILSSYSQAIDDVLTGSTAALTSAVSGVKGLVDGVGQLVAEDAARWQERAQRHQELSQQERDVLKEFLEEHQRDMKEVLQGQTLVGLSVLHELISSLKNITVAQRAVADQIEDLKETGQFFCGLVSDLAALREATVQNLNGLQDKHDQLEEQIHKTKENNQKAVQVLQDQLVLLARELSEDYKNLNSSCRALKTPLLCLQENLSSGCSSMEHQAAAQAQVVCSTSSSVASTLRLRTDESQRVLGEASDCCEELRRGVSGLLQRDQAWNSRLAAHSDKRARELLTLAGEELAHARSLNQRVNTYGVEQLRTFETELRARQEEVKRDLENLRSQTSLDGGALNQQQANILGRVEAGHQLIQNFLREELRHDVSTGQTPQRRDFVYPRQMTKTASRAEILESLRRLKAATEAEEDDDHDGKSKEDEDDDDDKFSKLQDSLEDKLSTCNESAAAEESFIDENLVFNESERVPFFKKKKGNKKRSKISSKPKVSCNQATSTPQKSKLPLRCQN
ncbi:kinesin-like protein KIF11 [Syngnathoides biaculeatus]|uniref:kinesin-like protein KIF11 n=1 Tax=Syngnathoides biaculeatus TaxID=300417 RepID=UPI002ADD4A09|nr:kinesin-like protein KIF11 [Syngnathoides biaculeatus]